MSLKKLSLHKETLLSLNEAQMARVAGGLLQPMTQQESNCAGCKSEGCSDAGCGKTVTGCNTKNCPGFTAAANCFNTNDGTCTTTIQATNGCVTNVDCTNATCVTVQACSKTACK